MSHVERGGQPAETTPRGPGFALRLLDGRALLTAVALDLDGLPDVPAGMTAQLLTLEVPHVRFPLEASGGAHKFRHRRLQLRTLDLRVPLPSLLALAPRTLCGFPVTHVSLDGVDGQLQARFVVETPSGAEDVVVQLALVPAPPAAVDVVVTRVAWLGAHGVALEVVEALAVALGARRQGSLTLRVEPVAPLLTRVLVCHGWKAPSLEKVEDLQVELLAGALRLRVLAEAAADAAAPQAAGGLARAAGANSVLSGASVQGGTRARSLDRAAAHPLALALTADALLQDPGARGEVEAALALARQRFPADVDLLLTTARLAPNSPAGWRQLLAATAGDPALAHGAAWLLGRTSGDLTALRRACAERPDHADSWVALARVAADQQQWGEAAAAARAALELDLSPAQEAQAATALGEVRLAQGDLAGARQALLRAQRQGAAHPGAAAAYGRLLSLEGRHAEAVHHLNRAVDAAVDERARGVLLAQAAAVTLDGLKDPAGAVALWRRVMAPGGAVDSYRGPAARAAWMAQDAELAGHWALGRGEGLPKDRLAALYGGLALARAGGQPVRARLLLEFAGEDAALRDDTWAAALASVQQAQVPAVPDEGTGVTSALLVSTAEDAPGPGENIHEELPEEDRTELRASPFATVTGPNLPAVRGAREGPALDVPTLAAMEPVEAATVFLHAYDAPGALRPALMELLDTLCETAPDRALAVMEELQARDPLPLTRWRLLARHAHQLGQALAEMAAWEVVRTTAPEAAQEALLHQAELLRAQDRAPDALARLMPQAMDEGGVLALRAADLAEELDQPDVALALLGAAEARTQGADGLAWARRARTTAAMAGKHAEAVAAARRAARWGGAEDQDALEEALEAAGEMDALAGALWDRALSELDMERALRAARVELGGSGGGATAALAGLQRVLAAGAAPTVGLAGALSDIVEASTSTREKAMALMLLVGTAALPETARMHAASDLESMALPEDLLVQAEEAILHSFPAHAPALARTARRASMTDPGRAATAALALVEALSQRGAPAMERLTWLQFAVSHAHRAGDAQEAHAVEALLEAARREPEAAKAASVDRRALLVHLAGLYEAAGHAAEAVRVLSHAELLDGPPEARAQVFKRIATLEEVQLARPERAVEALQHAVRAMPEDEEAVRALARALETAGRLVEAASLHASAAEHQDGPKKAAHLLAAADMAAREPDGTARAVALCRMALRAAPASDAPVRRLVELHRHGSTQALVRTLLMLGRLRDGPDGGQALEDAGALLAGVLDRPRLAAVVFRRAAVARPTSETAWRALAELHRANGAVEELTVALRHLGDVSREPRARAEARLARAEVLCRDLARDEDAWNDLQAALQEAPELPGVAPLGQQLADRLGRPADVERFARARMIHAPTATQAQSLGLEAARALIRLGDVAAALRLARAAVDARWDNPTAWNALRDAAVLAQDPDTQREATAALVELLREKQPALAAQEALQLARMCRDVGRPVDAVKAYSAAVELAPETPGLAFALGEALLEAGDAPEAWARLSRLEPNAASHVSPEEFARVLARAASGAGVFEEAEAWERVTALAPQDANAWQRLGAAAETAGAWSRAAQAWKTAAELSPARERARLLRRAARAAADAGQHAAAAAALEDAHALAPGPAAEHVLVARWRLNAGQVDAAAAALRAARDGQAEIPEEILAETAVRLHQASRTADARALLALAGEVTSLPLARAVLELAPDTLDAPQRAALHERMAQAATTAAARAALLDHAAAQWWSAGERANAMAVARQALDADGSQVRLAQVLCWAFEGGVLPPGELEALAQRVDQGTAAVVGTMAARQGAVASLPDVLVQLWATMPDAPAAALQELARRAPLLPEAQQVQALSSVVDRAQDAQDASTVGAGDEAARALADMFANKQDFEAARAWSLRLRDPAVVDLQQRLAWLLELERWREALETATRLAPLLPGDEEAALRERAVEMARDRLEDPAAALPHCRRWVDLRPDHRPARAALVELLEETQAWAQAAQEVAAWARRGSGVESDALWRKALQLAVDSADANVRVDVARQAHGAVPTVEHLRALVESLRESGDLEALGNVLTAHANDTGHPDDVWGAVDAWTSAGKAQQAAQLALKHFTSLLPPHEEERFLEVLTDAGLTRGLADRLRETLPQDDSGLAHARLLRRMPRALTTPMEIARVTVALAQREASPGRWLEAAAAQLAVGQIPEARESVAQARALGAVGSMLEQLEAALVAPAAQQPLPQGAAWVGGGELPEDLGDLGGLPNWMLVRLEEVASAQQRLGVACRALELLAARGQTLDAKALRQRPWLADPDARGWLGAHVGQRPELLGAALELLVEARGAGDALDFAVALAQANRQDGPAAAAWDQAAALAAEALDEESQRAYLTRAQRRAPGVGRGRRLLELARRAQDVPAQLEILASLVELDDAHAADWALERANLLLETGDLEEAARALAASHAQPSAWERLYRVATLSGAARLQRAALQGLAADALDHLALAAVCLQVGDLEACGGWLETARQQGLVGSAGDWLAVELAAARHDEDAQRSLLTRLARDGSEDATRRLTDLGGAEVDARLDALALLLDDGQGPAVAAELRRLLARGDHTRALVAQRVRAWCEPLGAFPPALKRAVESLAADEHDLPLARLLAEQATALGFPEMAARALEVQSQLPGPDRAPALRALATVARRAGRWEEERHALGMALLADGRDAEIHARLAERLDPPARWMHRLAQAQLVGDRSARLTQLLAEVTQAHDATWVSQVATALLGAGGAVEPGALPEQWAQRLSVAAANGYPAAALTGLVELAREDGPPHLLVAALEAALAHGRVDARVTHQELASLHQQDGRASRALWHAQQAARLAPEDVDAAQLQLTLARQAGDAQPVQDALLHLASLVSGTARADAITEAVDLLLAAGAHARALEVLRQAGVEDARLLSRTVEVARITGDRVALATALEAQLGSASTMAERASLALEVADAWNAAGDPHRALGAAIGQAGRSLAACEAIREAALQRGETNTALAVVRARWNNAGGQERRALVHHWMRVWSRMDTSTRNAQHDATRDLVLMQSTADAEDGTTLWWLARDAEASRRWEVAGQRWLQLATLSSHIQLPQDVLLALQTQGVSVLARTGSLDEAERLATARIQDEPTDRSAMEVLLAAARGRADAQEVVRLLSAMARASQEPEEKAFIWREAAEWMAGPLLDAGGAVTALRAAHAIKPLSAVEAEHLARLAAQTGDVAAELEGLDLVARLDPDAQQRIALRRAELMERRDHAAEAVLAVLKEALAHPDSRVLAAQRVADLALRTGAASQALEWVAATAPPTARRDAIRYWQARAMLAEAVPAASEAIKAHAELASLGEAHAAARVAHWLGQSAQPAQAARAWLDAAGRESQPELKASLLREAVSAWETAGDSAAADEARLLLLEVDARDVASFDAVEHRLRRQGKLTRLPALALRVAEAQEDHPTRARLFERAAVLLRDVAGDETAAASAFGRAVESDPFRASCLLALADLAFRRNNVEDAARWFSQVPDSADAAWPDIPAAETAYRRGVCLEASGGDGRVALRRCLELDPGNAAARAALTQAAERHGDPVEAARTLMGAQDAPNAETEPRAYATWMLKQAHALQSAGQDAAALALLEGAHMALPGNPGLVRALAVARQPQDPAAAAVLFRRVSQLSSTPEDRAAALRDEALAHLQVNDPQRAAEALLLAAQQTPLDVPLLRQALEAAATADAQALLVQLSTLLDGLPTPLDLTPEQHLGLAQALSQDKRAPVASLMRHVQAALEKKDTWHTRLLAVGAARRANDAAALVTHAEAALRNCPDPKMGAMLAAEAARAALMDLKDVERGVALVRAAAGMGGQDAKVRARLAEIFPEPLVDTSLPQAAVRALLEDGGDVAEAYRWLERVAGHQHDQRRVVLCREAASILGAGTMPTGGAPPLRAEATKAIMLHRDAEWLANGEFPARLARLVAGWSKEIHGVLQRPEIQSRSLSGDEARKLATDIRFARSLVDGTLPVVITDQPGAHLGGLVGPHLVLGQDVVRAPEPVRRAVLAVGFATVRWGLEASVTLGNRDLGELLKALTAVVAPEGVGALSPRARDMQAALEKSLKGRWPAGDGETQLARTALADGRLPAADEVRRLLGRVAFLAAGTLGATAAALEKVTWMDAKTLSKAVWSRALLRWVCLEEGVEARARLGLEELDV